MPSDKTDGDLAGGGAPAADRAAERCARQAEGLLEDGDQLLLLPFDARVIGWLLQLTRARPGLRLALPAAMAESAGGRRTQRLAAELGLACELVSDMGAATVCLAEARQLALDGSVALADGALAAVELFRGRGPLYALAPDGPDPAVASRAALPAGSVDAALVSAVATGRGVYRAAMVARFLDDRDTPLDVIPLL